MSACRKPAWTQDEIGIGAEKRKNYLIFFPAISPLNESNLHIVCFDIPYPVDHGGFFDLFYKIKALSLAGIKIHLHCFLHERKEQPILQDYCVSVNYYPRRTGWRGFSLRLPYIVHSRNNKLLRERLLLDDYPILLEGIHTAGLIEDKRFAGRRIFLRAHNVESLYYFALARSAPFRPTVVYYLYESWRLKAFEKKIANTLPVLTVAQTDEQYFRSTYHGKNCTLLPPFLPFDSVTSKTGMGQFCLYHGNLSIPENERMAFFLLRHVFKGLSIPFVIAGRAPSAKLIRAVHRSPTTTLVSNPDDRHMQELISTAQIHIIPSYNQTGIKLKLLNVLFNGRHCIVNAAAVAGTGLEQACHLGSSKNAWKSLVIQLYHQPFGEEEIRLRKLLLLPTYDAKENARQLIHVLQLHYR